MEKDELVKTFIQSDVLYERIIKLEIGKSYLTRAGKKVGPLLQDTEGDFYIQGTIDDRVIYWKENGKTRFDNPKYQIVAEIKTEKDLNKKEINDAWSDIASNTKKKTQKGKIFANTELKKKKDLEKAWNKIVTKSAVRVKKAKTLGYKNAWLVVSDTTIIATETKRKTARSTLSDLKKMYPQSKYKIRQIAVPLA